MSSRNRPEPVHELDVLIRNAVRSLVRRQRPAGDLREQILRRAAERSQRPVRRPMLPLDLAEDRLWQDIGQIWATPVYLYSPYSVKLIGLTAPIL